ncbi:pteridine reductase [Lysobacter solisilvae (ex Woo and Kim 2020)]|uniref:Pteridine reductase n=1 Tax=Agrilutibacter terrestris TaxID=2865112 RepID=A0A7H0G0I6_9GAMM|nr:pteridine reductase [Lysobacter terrestris]QNP41802.1 pteridine reductase [Lysobacter terrestris]
MNSARPVALVTGSARRLGATIARTLHAAGYDLALHCRHSRGEMDALAALLEQARPGSTFVQQAELADFDRLPELVAHAIGRFGRLDALVNNASAFAPTPIGTTTPAQWDALFASNARAPFFLAQAAAPHLAATRGAIVNLADIYGERPLRQHTVYCMAKAALLMLTKSLALELGPQVRVNAVSPGAILWPDHAGQEQGGDTERQQQLLARTPLGRTGTPEEVAEAVRWLLQDAHYSTGQVLHLDGGRLLDA